MMVDRDVARTADPTYISSDDSELLRKAIESYGGEICLEIGIGYGSNLMELRKRFTVVLGTDIGRTEGFHSVREKDVSLFITDCASCFRDEAFDLVVMNPPYLPSEELIDVTVDGGKCGFAVPEKFLRDAMRVIRKDGTILIVLSSETSFNDFRIFCRDNHLRFRPRLSKQLFFETITVYEIRLDDTDVSESK